MSRTKEYYMKNEPYTYDIEREYLFNDILAKESEYEEYENFNLSNKIEIGDARETKRSENKPSSVNDTEIEKSRL